MSGFTPKHILCPVDFSEHSGAALRVAGGLAKAFETDVEVVHAQRLEAPVYFTVAQAKQLKSQLHRSARAAKAYVEKFVAQHLSGGVPYSVLLMEDDPVSAVLKALRETRAGMIVMGTHGRTGLMRIRLGSVTESVLRQVTVPVLTVGPHIKPAAGLGQIRKILCPINYSDLARTTLEHAAALAEKTGAELQVVSVVESGAGAADTLERAREQLCGWVPAEMRGRCKLQEAIRQGTAAEQIVAEAKNDRADLIVVGAHPRSFLGTILFGSTTEMVIRNAPCPVLSVIRK